MLNADPANTPSGTTISSCSVQVRNLLQRINWELSISVIRQYNYRAALSVLCIFEKRNIALHSASSVRDNNRAIIKVTHRGGGAIVVSYRRVKVMFAAR